MIGPPVLAAIRRGPPPDHCRALAGRVAGIDKNLSEYRHYPEKQTHYLH
jgi:hypothetical protein